MTIEDELDQNSFGSEFVRADVNLLYTASWLTTEKNKFLKAYGISIQQFNILRILKGQKDKPATVKLLMERMVDKQSNASRLVDKLEHKKLVSRRASTRDRRKVDIYISERGLALLQEISPLVKGSVSSVKTLTEDEARLLNALLDKLRSGGEQADQG